MKFKVADDRSESAQVGELLYGEGNRRDHAKAIAEDVQDLTDKAGLSTKQANDLSGGAAEIFSDLGYNTNQSHDHFEMLSHHLELPPNPKVRAQWTGEARRLLRQKFGDEVGDKLKNAVEYVSSRPGFAKSLEASGMGSHPQFVVSLVEKVDRLRERGSLRMKPRGRS